MNRTAAKLILGLAVLLLAAGAAWWWWQGRTGKRAAGAAGEEAGPAGERIAFPVDLYFPAGEGLRVERREIQATRSPRDQVRGVVEALLAGPGEAGRKAGLVRPLPEGVELGTIVLTADGVAWIDLRQADHENPPAGGSTAETQMIYSVVNSVAANVPQAQRVALLWNGTQRLTFSGHLDTSRPFFPDRSLTF
jgi:spore germination protein GerM